MTDRPLKKAPNIWVDTESLPDFANKNGVKDTPPVILGLSEGGDPTQIYEFTGLRDAREALKGKGPLYSFLTRILKPGPDIPGPRRFFFIRASSSAKRAHGDMGILFIPPAWATVFGYPLPPLVPSSWAAAFGYPLPPLDTTPPAILAAFGYPLPPLDTTPPDIVAAFGYPLPPLDTTPAGFVPAFGYPFP